MPNHKASIKRVRADKKRNSRNVSAKSALKTVSSKVINAETKESAENKLKTATALYQKNANKKIIHKNTAARKISRLAKKVNKMKAD